MNRLFAIAALAVILLSGVAAQAQSLNFSGDGVAPIEIFADDGIEWSQEQLVFVARGNARAVRGEVTVHADELRAYYREKVNGGADIWRLDALGKVRIVGPNGKAFSGKAVYDVDNAILVLSEGKLKLMTSTDVITADKQLEYWEAKKIAVARGNATAMRGEKRLRADVLAAYFRPDEKGEPRIYRVEAFDRVKVVTGREAAMSERGVYNVESGVATLIGAVKIIRDANVLNGCRAEINLNTGVSTLHSCKDRVRGLIQPGKKIGKKVK